MIDNNPPNRTDRNLTLEIAFNRKSRLSRQNERCALEPTRLHVRSRKVFLCSSPGGTGRVAATENNCATCRRGWRRGTQQQRRFLARDHRPIVLSLAPDDDASALRCDRVGEHRSVRCGPSRSCHVNLGGHVACTGAGTRCNRAPRGGQRQALKSAISAAVVAIAIHSTCGRVVPRNTLGRVDREPSACTRAGDPRSRPRAPA